MTRYYGRGHCDICGVVTPLWQMDGIILGRGNAVVHDPILCGTCLRKAGEEPTKNRTADDLPPEAA